MRLLRIFIEGTTDTKFLKDLINYHFNKVLDKSDLVITGGWGELYNEKNLNILKLITDQGGVNLVIFDTDKNENHIEESYQKRCKNLTDKARINEVTLSLFLFPNNQNDGDRETLLLQVANPNVYIPFATCYDTYFDCLKQYNELYQSETGNRLKIWPDKERRKLALKNFLTLHGQKADEDKRDYTDTNFWNLDSPALDPLINFLRPHFS